MPTVISHAIVGSSLSLLAPTGVSRWRLATILAVLPILPDLDVLAFALGFEYAHPLGHRGFTHSIMFALAAAAFVPVLFFRTVARFSRPWWAIFLLAFLATMSHGVLDAFTDAGLGVGFFTPFDNDRYFFPWRPIATSPLSIAAFFDGPALRILANEMFWIGSPLVVFVTVTLCIRFLRSSR